MPKLSFLSSTALTTSAALMSGTGMAADLRMPVKAPPPVAAPFTWSGCYVGGHAGAASVRFEHDISLAGTLIESSGRDTGFIGGGQLGCNWQHSPNWVFGIEGDISYVGVKRSGGFAFTNNGEDAAGTLTAKLNWLGTLRGRFGPTWNRSFLYVTGGAAFGGVKSSITAIDENGATFGGSASETRFGWTVGAGWEYAFSDTISGKLEYLHFDLGNFSHPVVVLSGAPAVPAPWTATTRVSGDIIRAGINIRWRP